MAAAPTAHLDATTAAHARRWLAGWPELADLGQRPGTYLVGGSVRDLLLGIDPKDADLAVAGPIRPLVTAIRAQHGGALVPLHDAPPTVRIVFGDRRSIDVAAFRGPDILADLAARDFTINALALDLAALAAAPSAPIVVLDPTGGLADLRRGWIRPASPTALSDDPLRVLRGYRLLATLPPPLNHPTWRLSHSGRHAARRQAHLLSQTARERIAQELLGLVGGPRAWRALRLLAADGALAAALPAWSRTSGGAHLRRQRFPLVRRLVAARAKLAAHLGAERAAWLSVYLDHELAVGRPRRLAVAWLAAALDVARAGHPHGAAEEALVRSTGDSLRLSRREGLEARHMARALADAGSLLALPTGVAAVADRQLDLARLAEAAPATVLLAWLTLRQPDRTALHRELDRFRHVVAPLLAADPLVPGEQLMTELGLPAGPRLGRLIQALTEAHYRGHVTDAATALAWAKAWLASQPAGQGDAARVPVQPPG